tara:strand:- start:137 stop:610 length:474 start_codon:yes stop_codon:yes gene_type:complete
MKNTLNKFNFILGILSVIITFFPGMLIGEFAIIAIKVIGKIINSIISIFPSIYLRGFIDIIFEAFAFTAIGRGIGVAFIIFIPILLFRKFTKLNINWLPSIIILVPILLWFGGIRQIERYAELYEGLYFVSISAGFILGTFLPLYYAYLFSKEVDKS